MKKGNNTILRFNVDITATSFMLKLPVGAEIVDLGNDPLNGLNLQVWVACNPKAPCNLRAFCRIDTGQEFPYEETDLEYIGRAIAVGASGSVPGKMSPRTVHFFEATGQAWNLIEALATCAAG